MLIEGDMNTPCISGVEEAGSDYNSRFSSSIPNLYPASKKGVRRLLFKFNYMFTLLVKLILHLAIQNKEG